MNTLPGGSKPATTHCRRILVLAGALLGAVAFSAPAGAAETLTEVDKLVPESSFCNPSHVYEYCFNSELGIGVALDDETLMAALTIGNRNADYVYIFDVVAYVRAADDRWAPAQALRNYGGWEVGRPDLLEIDVDAARAMVGNPHWSDLPWGGVTAFGRGSAGSWSPTDSLRDPEYFDDPWFKYFGFDIDLQGSTAVIDGKVFEDYDGDWAYAQTLDSSLAYRPYHRTDFDGQTIVTAGPDFGVQIWERDPAGEWVVQQAIPDPGMSGEAGFGEAVGIDGDALLIGAPGTDGPGEAAGAVLAYLRGSDGRWARAATLQASDAGPGSRFGDRLVLDGTTALIRAPGADGAVPGGGAVYWFEYGPDGRWIERGKLVPSDGYEGDRFAHDFDLAGDTAVIGAPGRPAQEWPDYTRADAGAIYVYDLSIRSPLQVINIASDGTALDPRESNSRGSPTVAIDPVGVWYGPLSSGDDPGWRGTPRGSRWVSFLPSGSGGSYPPNNTVVSFFDEFEVSGQPVAATLRVLADDSAAVLLNGRVVMPEATRNQNYPTCSAFPIGCLENTMGILDLTRFLRQGTNRLEFRVAQRAGDGYGLNYLGQVVTADSLGEAVAFDPDPSSYYFTGNRDGCPAGFAGKFGFRAQLTNISELTLAELYVRVAELGGGNRVLTDASTTIGAGGAFPVAEGDDYLDGFLEPGEWVDVPFTVCLRRRVPFRLTVDVLGSTRVAAPASRVE